MNKKDFCQDCHQKDRCQEVYRQVGNSKHPSVVLKAILAFIFPIVVFICSLAVVEKVVLSLNINSNWNGGVVNDKEIITLISFFGALLITFVAVLLFKLIGKRIHHKL